MRAMRKVGLISCIASMGLYEDAMMSKISETLSGKQRARRRLEL